LSDNKKDLTRIEDLGEYLHELKEEASTEDAHSVPDLPPEETDFSENSFQPEEINFDSEEPAFSSSEDSSLFSSDELNLESSVDSSDFSTEETSFESNDDSSTFTIEESSTFTNSEDENIYASPVFDEPSSLTKPETISEPEPAPEVIQEIKSEQTYKTPENFQDLKNFAESTSISGMGSEGNPSFSVLLKNVRYIEDVNDIMSMLKELNLLSDGDEQIRTRLMRGQLLVPRISEFAAIFLAHKLRRFDIDIQVGLSDEIHPPKHQELPELGMVSKYSLYQNQTHHFQFDNPKLELSQIIVAASPNLEGHQVIRYLGVASEHKMLEGHIVEDESSSEIPTHYSELAQKLKAHALKAHANAVIGLNYQLTPLPTEYGVSGSKYRLSCTGNLVWVNKL